MNSNPDSRSPQSSGSSARPDPETDERSTPSLAGGRGKAYTKLPDSTITPQPVGRRKSRVPWLLGAIAAITLAVSGLVWKQDSLPHWTHPWSPVQQVQMQQQIQTLTLTDADVDHAATDAARAALSRGEIPPVLANADAETRNKVLSGEEKLYTKNLLSENEDKEVIVHVSVSSGGVLLGEDTLTMAHPQATTFPVGPGVPTLFHYTVEKAGPTGVVTCQVDSSAGPSVHTPPMPAGQSAELETIVR